MYQLYVNYEEEYEVIAPEIIQIKKEMRNEMIFKMKHTKWRQAWSQFDCDCIVNISSSVFC